jgi:dienelactone hydrolase
MSPKKIFALLSLLMAPFTVAAAVVGEEIAYSDGEITMKGYLAWDDAISGPRPGVLVVHEWWGHNGYARRRAEMLAEMGYTALAVDMYGDGKTADHPSDAGAFSAVVRRNMPLAEQRFSAALTTLERHPSVAKGSVAAIGYCFGGSVVLEMARRGLPLSGVASFHGALTPSTPAEAGRVKSRVIVFTGGADPMIPATQIEAFKAEMAAAAVASEVIIYPNAKHSFTNPAADEFAERFKMPVGYDAAADSDSWQRLDHFLREIMARK